MKVTSQYLLYLQSPGVMCRGICCLSVRDFTIYFGFVAQEGKKNVNRETLLSRDQTETRDTTIENGVDVRVDIRNESCDCHSGVARDNFEAVAATQRGQGRLCEVNT